MNLTEVLTHDGKEIKRQEEITMDVLSMPDGHYPITQKSPVDLTVINRGDKVLDIKCIGSLHVLIPCARCLTDVPVTIDIDLDEAVDMSDPQAPTLLTSGEESEQDRFHALETIDFIHGYQLDVDALVKGEALLNWPSQVLCREDCKGLCRICGQNLNLRTCGCESAELDPRMAKIRDIFRLASREE